MEMLYPLTFKDVFKEKVWGGNKIHTILGKDFRPLIDCGEVWLLSALPGSESEVKSGRLAGNTLAELVEVFMDELVGERIYESYGDEFPLLCKFIDANDYLSIQVHPGDALARQRHASSGKAEMWYVVHAEPGARLINGFKEDITPEIFLKALQDNKLQDYLQYVDVQAGDVFDIPPGRVHALGPGILLAEIQQAADITYRVYDWNRPGKDGRMRDLHIDLALDAIDYKQTSSLKTAYPQKLNETVRLTSNAHFSTAMIQFDRPVEKDLGEMDSCVVYLCTQGQVECRYQGGNVRLQMGDLVLVPAMMQELTLVPLPAARLIEVHL
ncbi:MAG: class I mannose-6-phosphate isomerase [Lentimicrobiaceae bacterium]|nr:class I mannose-6-phosphate isomerase [Lentimicrobiaceae bacterium]